MTRRRRERRRGRERGSTPRSGATLAVARLLAATALLSASAAAQQRARASVIEPDVSHAPVSALMRDAITQAMRDYQLPGLSIAIIDDGRIVWARGFGTTDSLQHDSASAETVYPVGALSTVPTAIGLMQLVERGSVDLDAPVARYLTEFHPVNPFRTPISIRHLLTHRSGLVRESPVGHVSNTTGASLAATVASLDSTTLVLAPGTRVKYSNAGVAVAGLVLERVARESFASYMARHVLAPLGMDESAFELSPALASRVATGYAWSYDGRRAPAPRSRTGESPALSLYSTVTDLGRLMIGVLARDTATSGRVLRSTTLRTMWAPRMGTAGARSGAGIGVWLDTIDGARAVTQSGAIDGVSSELLMLPDERMGVVVVTTLDGSNGVARRLASTALRAMLAERRHRPMPRLPTTDPVAPGRAAMLAGRYRSLGTALELTYITAPSDSDAAATQLTFRFDSAGTRGILRQRGDSLVRDDRLGFGLRILPRGNALMVAGRRFVRDPASRPAPLRPQLAKLVGEYGSDRDIFYILEDHGRIEALAGSFFQAPLVRISDSTFAFPRASFFDAEPVRFSFDDAGAVIGVRVGGVWRPRRAIGPASGNQLLVTPVRPIAELEREARAAKAPVEAGRRAPQLVELVALDSTIHLEIRYATTHNFLGTRFYPEARAFLQRPAAEALVRAHRWLRTKGYGILVHDSYRPWYVTRMFWDAVPADKKIFVADPSQGSRHNRGAAADITLYDLATGAPVEMPGTYDETSDRSFANYPGGTSLQRWHRALLRQAMEAEGFTVYHAEWWHFDYRGWAEYPVLNIPFSDIPPASSAPH